MSLNKRKLSFLALFFLLSSLLFAQDAIRSAGEKILFQSDFFDHDKPIRIYLPASYESSTKVYPVLYVTDAEEQFAMAAGVEPFLSDTMVTPELIIVGIPHANRNEELTPVPYIDSDTESLHSRIFAGSGQADRLNSFIKEELIPYMDANYRTAPFRVLFGHSLGGLHATHLYLTEPGLFQSYIASDPSLWYNNRLCNKIAAEIPAGSEVFNSFLFLSGADIPMMVKTTKAFYQKIKKKAQAGMGAEFRHYTDDNHMTVPLKTLTDGLIYSFREDDYHKIDDFSFESYDLNKLQEYYRQLSDKRGYEVVPPSKIVKHVGLHHLDGLQNAEGAIEAYQYYITLYPGSSLGHELLARSYRLGGEREKALESCRRALELDPHSCTAARLMEELAGA